VGSTPTSLTAAAVTSGLQAGVHILYFFATDGSDATSINPIANGNDSGESLDKRRFSKISLGAFSPESSPVIGGINAYLFLVAPAPTAASVSVSGRVLTAEGRGLMNAAVVMTDSHRVSRRVRTGKGGYYLFDGVQAGQSYVMSVASKLYRYSSRVVSVEDQLTDVDFIPGSKSSLQRRK